MSHNDIEIEIKLPLLNLQEVCHFLNNNAQCISEKIYQKDTYYTPAHRNFLEPEYPFEWLRLRESAKGMFINYKHFYPENAPMTDYCDEYETKVENISTIQKIFSSLNVQELIVVEKTRSTWMWHEAEIAVDTVTDLGDYIELEAKKSFSKPQDAKEYLRNVAKLLNAKVGEEEYRGYPFILLAKKIS